MFTVTVTHLETEIDILERNFDCKEDAEFFAYQELVGAYSNECLVKVTDKKDKKTILSIKGKGTGIV